MSGWDIKPDAVGTVLGNTKKVAGKLKDEFSAYGASMESASKWAGTIVQGAGTPKGGAVGPVGAALREFGASTENELKFLAARTGKSVAGAAEATMHYLEGDLQMAADTQNAAAQKPTQDELDGKGGKK